MQIHHRRSIGIVCLAVLLLAVLIPSGPGIPVAVLTLLWLFVAPVVPLSICSAAVDSVLTPAPLPAATLWRAPPIA
jgi:hypothetical protein